MTHGQDAYGIGAASDASAPDGMALDAARIGAALPASVRTLLDRLDCVAQIDSTNAELLRRPAPARGIAVLLADRQSAGRGRAGRVWASPPGANLYLSLSRRFDCPLAALAPLTLAVGVCVAEALHALGAHTVRLKWPNDLVVMDGVGDGVAHGAVDGRGGLRKLGGILVEAGRDDAMHAEAGRGRAGSRAVVGLGLNLRMPVEAAAGIDQPWCDLSELLGDRLPPREAVAAAVIAALLPALDAWERDGLRAHAAGFARLDALAGREVQAMLGTDTLAGIAAGIDASGALRLQLDSGEVRTVHAGEVRVRAGGSVAEASASHASAAASAKIGP